MMSIVQGMFVLVLVVHVYSGYNGVAGHQSYMYGDQSSYGSAGSDKNGKWFESGCGACAVFLSEEVFCSKSKCCKKCTEPSGHQKNIGDVWDRYDGRMCMCHNCGRTICGEHPTTCHKPGARWFKDPCGNLCVCKRSSGYYGESTSSNVVECTDRKCGVKQRPLSNAGPAGPRGETGKKGEAGMRGAKGLEGESGASGIGELGSAGPPGYDGAKGERGETKIIKSIEHVVIQKEHRGHYGGPYGKKKQQYPTV